MLSLSTQIQLCNKRPQLLWSWMELILIRSRDPWNLQSLWPTDQKIRNTEKIDEAAMMSRDLLCVYVCYKRYAVDYLCVCVRVRRLLTEQELGNRQVYTHRNWCHSSKHVYTQAHAHTNTNTFLCVDAFDLQLTGSPRPAKAGYLSKALYFHVSLPFRKGRTTHCASHNLDLGPGWKVSVAKTYLQCCGIFTAWLLFLSV